MSSSGKVISGRQWIRERSLLRRDDRLGRTKSQGKRQKASDGRDPSFVGMTGGEEQKKGKRKKAKGKSGKALGLKECCFPLPLKIKGKDEEWIVLGLQ
jgi:hypothetical protein